MKKLYILIAMTILWTSCSDFLVVKPKDRVLEEDLYKTESGINSALNGIYRQLISTDLYGGNLSQTSVEAMGHVYTYPTSQPTSNYLETTLFYLANGNYTSYSSVTSIFANIWREGYNCILNINYFIECLDESKAILTQEHKNIMLGEAYGLRAYMHFDLFRLFGPRYEERTNEKILPYNKSTDVVLNHIGYEEDVYITAEDYFANVLEDIRTAEDLLQSDPILTDPAVISEELVSDFYMNRNRRMNYYAVKALEARVLQYMGDITNAAIAAKTVTDQVGEYNDESKPFCWANPTSAISDLDYIFFHEIVFGINNPDMSSNYESFFESTSLRDFYGMDRDNLISNIYAGFGENLSAIVDIRSRQWTVSNNTSSTTYSTNGTYISRKLNISPYDESTSAYEDLQPLIRITEMYYIQAEAALSAGDKITAAELLNKISTQRGIPDTNEYFLDENSNETTFEEHIESEYYKEFFGEGQIYFYHKRKKSPEMFKGNGAGRVSVNTETAYTVELPDIETDI